MPVALTLQQIKIWIDLEIDEFKLEDFRKKYQIAGDSPNFHTHIQRLIEQRYIKKVKRATYRKVKLAQAIKVFGRQRRPLVIIKPPEDRDTGEPMDFLSDIVFREGDLILISGFKNRGKTNLCLNIIGENLDKNPVLMGNEYTVMGKDGDFEPSPRLLNRLDSMNWVKWIDGNNKERFELLPVYQDYAEQIRPGRLNVIDWINLPGEYYMISPVMEEIKRSLGSGIGIVVLQKNPGSEHGRGGNPSKDFADVELLLDPFGEDKDAVMLTVETVKESKQAVQGRKFVYKIRKGVEIVNLREVVKCGKCFGKGWRHDKPCDVCDKVGYIDKGSEIQYVKDEA